MKKIILAMVMLVAVVSAANSAEKPTKNEKYTPEQRFAKLRKASEALLERHQALREKNTELEAEIAQFAAAKDEVEQLKQRIILLEAENKQLKVTAAASSEKLLELADLKKQLKRLTQQASVSEEVREEHIATQVALTTLQKQHQELERLHKELSKKHTRMDTAHDEASALLEREQQLGQEADAELAALRKTLKAQIAEINSLKQNQERGQVSHVELTRVKELLIKSVRNVMR